LAEAATRRQAKSQMNPMAKIQNSKHLLFEALGHLDIGDWKLFVIWDL
jgi:hypothetical protein